MNGFASIDLVWLMMASVFSYAVYVKVFKKLGQTERKEGVASHQKKTEPLRWVAFFSSFCRFSLYR